MEKVDGASMRHPWETARLKFVWRLLGSYLGTTRPVVVDVGCGDAYFVRRLRSRYPDGEFYAVDIALSDADLVRLHEEAGGGVRFFNRMEDLVAALESPADVVLFMDVIEHVEDDVALLQQVLRSGIASKDTCVVITVPAYQWLFSSHDVFLRHFRRYSRSHLERSARDAGLRVLRSGYFFSSLLLPRMLGRLRERFAAAGEPEGIGGWRHGRMVTGILSGVLYADALVSLGLNKLNIRLPGLSVFAVCRPS